MACTGYGTGLIGRYGKVERIPYHCRKAISVSFFMDQLLIYAQRPDATACAELETWNQKMNCWVNRGSKGIALLDESRPFGDRLVELAHRIADDYYRDVMPDLQDRVDGSFLYGYDELNLELRLQETMRDSIAYTLLTRCGVDTELYDFDFRYLHEFSDVKTLSVLGNAVSEMTEPVLMEIGRAVTAQERHIARYGEVERQTENSIQPSKYVNGCLAYRENKYVGSITVDEKEENYKKLCDITTATLKALPTPDYAIPFHAEFFCTAKNEIIFCEIASRVGGGRINTVFKQKKGVNLMEVGILAQFLEYNDFSVKEKGGYFGWMMLPQKVGKLVDIINDMNFDFVIDPNIRRNKIGKSFNGGECSASEIVSTAVKGDSIEDLLHKFKKIEEWYDLNVEFEAE